jgi:glycolate oxidase
LGVFTKIILKLMPLPKEQVDLLALFKTSEEAIAAVPKMMGEGGIIPTSIEFMDRLAVKGACDYLNESLPYEDAGAMLLISVDGNDKEVIERDYDAIGEFCLQAGAIEVYVADNSTTSERIWKVRRNIAEAYNLYSTRQSGEDIVVPPSKIPDMIKLFDELSNKYGVIIPCFGHAGDGNLHARILSNPEWSDAYWNELLPTILKELYVETKALGGTLSGEHGIGCKRRKYLGNILSPEHIAVLKGIKQTFDPNGVLNPGKII